MGKVLIFLSVLIFTLSTIHIQTSRANTLSDTNDLFEVINPKPNSKLEGNVEITLIMFDDDKDSIPFVAEVRDANTCTQNYGSITNLSNAPSSSVPFTINWDSNSTLTNILNDGNYCLRICAELQNENSYSTCNSRIITLVNNNELPFFTKFPENVKLYEEENFTFNLEATDPDGDNLTLRLIQAPNFVNLQNSQLQIKAPIINTKEASYKIIIAVDDNFSGETRKEFSLTIKQKEDNTNNQNESPTQKENSSNSDQNSSENNLESSKEYNLNFINPKLNDVIKSEALLIQWDINPDINVKEQTLEFSTNLETFYEIVVLQNNERTYTWDLEKIDNGVYYLKIKAQLDNGVTLSKISENFTIEKENTLINVPLIVDVSPSNETLEPVQNIQGKLVPPPNSEIDTQSLQVFVNSVNITQQCEVKDNLFNCKLSTPLDYGVHKIDIKISDTNGNTNDYSWQVTVTQNNEAETDSTDSVVSYTQLKLFGRKVKNELFIVIGLICFAGLIILLAPWFLFAIWRKDDDEILIDQLDNPQTQTTITTNQYPIVPAPQTYSEPTVYNPDTSLPDQPT